LSVDVRNCGAIRPLLATLVAVRNPPILLKNSFLATEQNFAAPWSRQYKKDWGGSRFDQKSVENHRSQSKTASNEKVAPHRIWRDF
jgi:hypothetical protein